MVDIAAEELSNQYTPYWDYNLYCENECGEYREFEIDKSNYYYCMGLLDRIERMKTVIYELLYRFDNIPDELCSKVEEVLYD